MTSNGNRNGSNGSDVSDLTDALETARRGFRRDVQTLVDALDVGELFVPLAHAVPDAPYGERVTLDSEVTLSPHMLVDEDGKLYCALFTRPEMMAPLEETLGWSTDDDPLEYCALPARVALDMALSVIDEASVFGLVVNPLHDSELMLRREELGSIAQNKAVPLVGYVQEIPPQPFEHAETIVAEMGDPPPPELVAALDRCVAELPTLAAYTLSRTFNAERDLEPHLTLALRTTGQEEDLSAIARHVIEQIEDKLPPPGYIDVMFDEPAN